MSSTIATAYYGAKYEPPDGKIYNGVGWQRQAQISYQDMLPDSLQPLLFQNMSDLPGMIARGGMTVANLLRAFRAEHINQETQYIELSTHFQHNGVIVDDVFWNSDEFDGYIDTLAIAFREYGRPIFFRIAYEVNGAWNAYHPFILPLAYRKLVEGIRERDVDNFATVWCYEPDAPNDFADSTDRGWKWYPGDDVVDWFSLDPFDADHFDPDEPDSVEGRNGWSISKKGKTEQFLSFARERGKPVYLSELSARHVWITPYQERIDSTHGSVDWEYWFEPFFEFLDNHQEIKAFNYINLDWTQYPTWEHWGDARLHINEYIRDRWIEAMGGERFIHSGYDISQPVSVPEPVVIMPDEFDMSVYPNPFNARTKINFSLKHSTLATVTVYDLHGRLVEVLFNGDAKAGVNQLTWNADQYSSGVYLLRFESEQEVQTKKTVLIR